MQVILAQPRDVCTDVACARYEIVQRGGAVEQLKAQDAYFVDSLVKCARRADDLRRGWRDVCNRGWGRAQACRLDRYARQGRVVAPVGSGGHPKVEETMGACRGWVDLVESRKTLLRLSLPPTRCLPMSRRLVCVPMTRNDVTGGFKETLGVRENRESRLPSELLDA
jgi:hypothetical protein